MSSNIVATKANVIATKKSLSLANLGYRLLDKKRVILIREMTLLLEDVEIIRNQLTSTYQKAYDAMQQANISLGVIAGLVESAPIDTGITIAYRSVMGVEIPKVIYQEMQQNGEYNLERSNSKVDYAYQCFSEVKALTVSLATIENSLYRLANAIRKTKKRANSLQYISIPELEKSYKIITAILEEKDREEFVRQKVVKEKIKLK